MKEEMKIWEKKGSLLRRADFFMVLIFYSTAPIHGPTAQEVERKEGRKWSTSYAVGLEWEGVGRSQIALKIQTLDSPPYHGPTAQEVVFYASHHSFFAFFPQAFIYSFIPLFFLHSISFYPYLPSFYKTFVDTMHILSSYCTMCRHVAHLIVVKIKHFKV